MSEPAATVPTPPASANPAAAVTHPSRRGFLRSGSMLSLSSLMGTATLMAQPGDAKAAVEWAEHFQKNYRLMTPAGEGRAAAAAGEALLAGVRQEGQRRHHRGPARRADGLRAEHPQVHRLPPLREGLRRGEQPVARRAARRAHRVDPGAAHGARRVHGREDEPGLPRGPGHPGRRQLLHPGRPGARGPVLLRAREGAREGRHLHAHRLHAVREAALREGVPGAHHLPRGRRPGGHRLQLVHRLQDVHERLPLLGAALQPHHAGPAQGRHEPGDALPGQPAAHARRGREVPLVPAAHAPRPLPGLRRGLPGRRAQVRQPARPRKRGAARCWRARTCSGSRPSSTPSRSSSTSTTDGGASC